MQVVFGEFSFDSAVRELTCDGRPVHLSPKAFDLLGLLIGRRPVALAKEDLYAYLWPETFVEEANLKNLVAEIRAALRDDARAPRFVKTHYGYGYSFMGGASERPRATSPAKQGAWIIRYFSRDLPLQEGENVVGRDPTCAVVIDQPDVSRFHARIETAGPNAAIEDLGSKNGTYVNGARITEKRALGGGEEIRLGDTVISLHHREPLQSTKSASFRTPNR